MSMRIIVILCPAWTYNIFLYYLKHGKIFEKKFSY